MKTSVRDLFFFILCTTGTLCVCVCEQVSVRPPVHHPCRPVVSNPGPRVPHHLADGEL